MASDFAIKLKTLREEKGWTQAEAAQNIGVTERQYQRYEGKTFPRPDKIKKATRRNGQLQPKLTAYDLYGLSKLWH